MKLTEIKQRGYKALIEALGGAGTLKFFQQLGVGYGDYTKERHQWLDKKSLEDVFAEMKQRREDDPNQYEEIIK